MKPNSIKILMALFIGFTLGLSAQAQAQDDEKDKSENIIIENYLKKVDAKIKKAFETNKPLRDEMEAELTTISKMSSSAEISKAMITYKKKHSTKYFEILKAAGLTTAGISDDLKKLLPDWNWSVSATYEIKGSKSENTMKKASKPTGSNVKTTNITFNFTQNKSCSLIAGGDAKSTSTSLTATSAAAVAGGCSASARFDKGMTMGTYTSATVTMTCNAALKSFALGIPGFAQSKASARVSMIENVRSSSITTMALFLWYSEDSGGFGLAAQEVPVANGLVTLPVSILAKTSAANFGIGSGTNSESKITGIDFKVNIVQ